jgi:hypothetical protein
VRPLTNQKVLVGSRAEFVCEASGIPRPTITWYINALPIKTNFGIFIMDYYFNS